MPTFQKTTVRFPDLSTSFLTEFPRLNKNYATVSNQSEISIMSACDLSSASKRAVRECDFSYFAAVMIPSADQQKYRTVCDWGNWIFPFDDMFDNGALRDDPDRANAVMSELLATLEGGRQPYPKASLEHKTTNFSSLVDFHANVWNAIQSDASHDVQQRYRKAMAQYCAGTVNQVYNARSSRTPSMQDVLDTRRQSVCVVPLFALIEFAHGIVLPDEILDSATISEIRTLAIDITLLHNDLLSYPKEEAEGVPHNVVAACRRGGMTAQEAVDRVALEIRQRLALLEEALVRAVEMKSRWHYDTMRYIEGAKDVVRANLYWSFHSDRFFSDEQKTRLLTTRLVDVSLMVGFDKGDKGTTTDLYSGQQHAQIVAPVVQIEFWSAVDSEVMKPPISAGLLGRLLNTSCSHRCRSCVGYPGVRARSWALDWRLPRGWLPRGVCFLMLFPSFGCRCLVVELCFYEWSTGICRNLTGNSLQFSFLQIQTSFDNFHAGGESSYNRAMMEAAIVL
ncbi:hypothetical protein Q7P37_009835 [Cladosporium fusiforme]